MTTFQNKQQTSIQHVLKQYSILDTEPEDIYDDITELAAEICQVPVAVVSFVDHVKDRIYFKAKHGMMASEGPIGRKTHCDLAFCSVCILHDDIFIVEDARDHPDFKCNESVAGAPYIRFYAGVPLKVPSGEQIGTVCVVDVKPRTLTEKQQICLKQLAKQVVSHLELRKNIMELEQAKKDLMEKNEKLDLLHAEKNKFLGMVSHDIRQPLANIMVSCELMMDDPVEKLSPQNHDLALTIHSSANFMHVLVDDLLQVIKVDYGMLTIELDQQYWDILKLVKNTVVSNTLMAQRKNINLEFSVNNISHQNVYQPITCCVDENKITQVMNNLISNAVKFSFPHSTIQVIVTKSINSVLIEVKDHGQGIPPSEMHKLFNPFERIKGVNPTAGESSTCLGLVIVKTIVQAHNGTIDVKSEYGQGTTFSVTLPLPHGSLNTVLSSTRELRAPEVLVASVPSDDHLRILVVDDNLVNLRLYRRVLEKRGHVVVSCSDGQECLEVLFQLGLDHFDLLVIDEEMPKLTGHEVIQIIRNTEHREVIPLRILSISGYNTQEHRNKMLNAGANECCTKPIHIQQLIQLVEFK
jgi:signal transduction histidine kinase/ActR/RegA family two-component response regulator